MTSKHYPDIEPNPNFAALEEAILTFWKENKTFDRSVANRAEKNPDGASNAYVFYDGPPFANGLPHYGHLLTGYVKDAIARYHTMKGARVERRFGWDCHGLPAEMGAEKELGISGRAAIAGYGIDKFNEYCRTSVMKYTQEWEYYVTRQGRWVDFKNDYKTMDKSFMESCVWAFSELYKKGLVYESMRVMPYSWAAETPVSNFETRIDNATREREDKAATVAFKLTDKSKNELLNKYAPASEGDNNEIGNVYVMAWTTTPWTLPSNLALAIGKLEYIWALKGSDLYIMAKNALPSYEKFFGDLRVAEEDTRYLRYVPTIGSKPLNPSDLLNLTYEPLFPYFADTPNAFRILDGSDFVTEGDGTGIVHMAPGFGEVDQKCCNDNGIETLVPVDEKGRFTAEIYDIPWPAAPTGRHPREGGGPGQDMRENDDMDPRLRGDDGRLSLQGLVVVPDTRIPEADIKVSDEDAAKHIAAKDIAKYGLANMRIVRWLKANGALVKDEPVKHNYPHCWRTDTPLIYRAMSSWYVAINTPVPALGDKSVKDVMAANNLTINWIPDHVQSGQMGKGIESAPDWSVSRNRFWGTPIPIWKSPSGKIIVPGSIAEIEQLSGQKVADLHRPLIDAITFTKDGETYTRIEDVFDCWFESGSMPFAQLHYPFENKQRFEESFPADFITEYIAQTRGWFYTLQVLSAALFNCAPFKNCICHGVVIDEETGLKYSKRLKNYRDPKEVMDQYGADALRWMMLASPVMRGADLGVDPDGKFIRDVVRLNIKPLWSAFNFFTLYANADGVKAKSVISHQSSVTSEKDSSLKTEDWRLMTNMLDRYILAKAKAAVTQVQASMDGYDTPGATDAITAFLDVLNNWYIRRSRVRFWAEEVTADKQAAYDTLYTVLDLICRVGAPLLPFTTEAIYRGLNAPPTKSPKSDLTPPQGGSSQAAGPQTKNLARISGESVGQSGAASSSPLEGEPNRFFNDLVGGISVHLTDFPDVSRILNEEALVADMDRVRDACTAMASIRSTENIRNRQPLASATLYGAGANRLRDYSELMMDELNVKEIRFADSLAGVAEYTLTIDFKVAGKRLGGKMKAVGAAAKSGDWKKQGDDIIVGGETMEEGEYNLQLKPLVDKGAQRLSTNDALVVLDLTITPELEAEGQARDLVRMIQQARKDAGLNVADRIALAMDVPENFKAALATHRDYIAEQTLAVSIGTGSGSAAQQMKQELDGEEFIIGISKAA